MATEDDLPIILRFIQDLAVYERLRDKCVANLDKLRKTLFTGPPAAEVLIARIDGNPVGFALFFPSYSTFLAQPGIYLEDLFVDPAARGKGVGFALLASLAQLAVERGSGRLEWAVLTWNQLAIDFYERIGARPMTDWRTYRLEGDALTHVAEGAPA